MEPIWIHHLQCQGCESFAQRVSYTTNVYGQEVFSFECKDCGAILGRITSRNVRDGDAVWYANGGWSKERVL